jgi:hypothetical protein
MPDFLAQSYLADRGKALAAIGEARQIRSPLLLCAILVPSDEIFLTLWRGCDADAVDTAAREVGLDPDRVVRAEQLPPGPGRMEPGRVQQGGPRHQSGPAREGGMKK